MYDRNTDSSGDHKTIRLKKYSFNYPPPGKIAAIEVLPVMWDTARRGFVQVGMANKRIEAVPKVVSRKTGCVCIGLVQHQPLGYHSTSS